MAFEQLTVDEALALIEPGAETVHVYTTHFVGADWPREAVEEAIRGASVRALLTKGPHARMGHHGAWSLDGHAMSFWTVQNYQEALAAFRAALTTPGPAQEVSDG